MPISQDFHSFDNFILDRLSDLITDTFEESNFDLASGSQKKTRGSLGRSQKERLVK